MMKLGLGGFEVSFVVWFGRGGLRWGIQTDVLEV